MNLTNGAPPSSGTGPEVRLRRRTTNRIRDKKENVETFKKNNTHLLPSAFFLLISNQNLKGDRFAENQR